MSDSKPKSPRPLVGGDISKSSRVVLWQYGMYAFAVGSLVLLAAVHLRYLIFERTILAPAILMTLVCVGIARVIFTSIKGDFVEPTGLEVTTAEPALTEFVHHVAAHVGAPRPDEIYLTNEVELRVEEANERFGLRIDRSVLLIGVPLLKALDQPELAALLGHELAHFTPNAVPQGVRALRTLRFATSLVRAERRSALEGVFGSYARKIFRSVGGIAVAQEQAAERAAVDAYGTQAMLSALAKIDDVGAAWDQMLRDYVVPALQDQRHPVGLFDGFGELLASPVRAAQRADDVIRRRAAERKWYVLHLNAAERTAVVASWPEVAASVVVEPAPAIELLEPAGDSVERLVPHWAAQLLTSETEPASWEELATEVYSLASADIAALGLPTTEDDSVELSAVDRFDMAAACSQSGDWSSVLDSLKKPLKRIKDPQERLAEWARCVVLETAATHRSFGWRHSWDGRPTLVDSRGSAFEPEPIAQLLLDGKPVEARRALEATLV